MDDEEEYGLQPPAPPRRDTITRQMQREILGEVNENVKEPEPAHLEQKTEEDDPPSSTPSKRRTLSPSKAAQLLNDAAELDASISRWDTASPGALKSLLQAEEASVQQNRSPVKIQDNLETSQQVQDSPARSTRSMISSASKRPRSTSKTSPVKARDSRRDSSSFGNTSDSFTNSMFAPNLLEQDEMKRATLDPAEAASVVAELQKEAWSLSTSAVEMDEDSGDDNQLEANKELKNKAPSPSKQGNDKKTPSPSKMSKLHSPAPAKSKKSPTPSKEAKSKNSPSPAKESTSRKSPSPAMQAKSSQTSSSAAEAKTKKSHTPPKSNSKRRETVDPGDVLTTLEDNLRPLDDRRQTIDDNGLLELASGLDSPSAGGTDSKRREEASRKRGNVSAVQGGTPEKRARAINSYSDVTMEYMDIDSPNGEAKSSPLQENHGRSEGGTGNQRSPDELPPSQIPKPSLFSPPPGGTQIRTPLKGILSARKARRNVGNAIQTTPNKTVNFGPSQGAEFNHGSPSTSMTPMPAKDASRLFPLERVSSEEEPDDAETSLNSSILDEADSLDEGEPEKVNGHKISQQLKKPGFDLLQTRRSSLMAPKSTDKSQRRHSMRGYSPLDSRAEIRRRRRQTITVTRQTSKSSATTSFTADKKTTESSQSPSTSRNNSFLRTTDVVQTSRMPYADSSASSDAGEDMEITGDYSIVFGRESEVAGKQSIASSGLPRDEDTAEFSLGHLLAESSVYELTKSAPEPDLHDLPGSLSDLANEVADSSSSQSSQVTNATRKSNDRDTTLGPIQESNESMTSSRNQSAMSLASDESDEEYAANRASLRVNLKSQFDRVSEPSQSPRRPPTPEALSVHLITMDELLSSIALSEEETLVQIVSDFFGEDAEASENQVSKDVKLACAHDTCSEVIERHAQDVSSWTSAAAEELSSLLQIKAPAVFIPENFDDVGREAVQKLYATEAMVARTGWCQLQAQMEKQLVSSLSLGADALALDVKSLKDNVTADNVQRQNEIAAINEMIEREEQMSLLLDAIEEQQGAHDEYVAAVKNLEKECSSLSLEESVLQSRLKVLEGRAAELEPVTSAAATLFEQEVLATEEMLAIQESMSVWKIREATASILRLSARFEDVLFDVEICVDVYLGASSTGGTSTAIKTNESLKRKEGNIYLPYEGDVVLVLQRLLLDPHYISRIADETELGNGNEGLVCSKLQVLEHFISRSFRLLKELRELSTHFAMRYDEDDSTLWVDFLKFPSVASRMDVEGAQFSVGFSLLPVFPYTDYQTAVHVPHGQVSTDAVAKEIELVSSKEPKYFTRVCRRLHESFVR
ncbi:hypothetical protein V7S43_006319 [Phytophthora oleae]|uniref:Spc7 kinetochore protein domain-containing protein n=1 Tax=Phytophthora oleae TaxID=2107226 RepID=A0ABD3FVM7_9STRA